jgi:hypothetical protein
MKVTKHAAQRFLERVVGKDRYDIYDIHYAQRYLYDLLARVVPGSYGRPFGLPEHKGYKVVHREGSVLTIVPREWVDPNKPKRRWS